MDDVDVAVAAGEAPARPRLWVHLAAAIAVLAVLAMALLALASPAWRDLIAGVAGRVMGGAGAEMAARAERSLAHVPLPGPLAELVMPVVAATPSPVPSAEAPGTSGSAMAAATPRRTSSASAAGQASSAPSQPAVVATPTLDPGTPAPTTPVPVAPTPTPTHSPRPTPTPATPEPTTTPKHTPKPPPTPNPGRSPTPNPGQSPTPDPG